MINAAHKEALIGAELYGARAERGTWFWASGVSHCANN